MDGLTLRDLVAREFAIAFGTGSIEAERRIPWINMLTRKLARRFDATGWPDIPDIIEHHIKPAVREYG